MSGRLAGRVALITGASRGIGAAVAVRYAEEGAHVILVARTQGGLEEVDDKVREAGGEATLAPFDLTDGEAIDRLGAAVAERWKRLDVLVANAGMLGRLAPMGHFPPEEWEQVMALNVGANWRLIRAFDPLLKASDAGRAIFVTSGITQQAVPYWGAYAVSKAALEALALTYAAEVVKTDVRVNLVNPGATRTRMRAQAFPGEDPKTLPPPEALTDTFVSLAEPTFDGHGLWIAADQTLH